MFRRFRRKRVVVALSAVAVLALAAGAYAYFSSSGSGGGQATVGSSSPFNVTVAAPTGGPLYPGSGTENLSYTIKNPSAGTQNLSTTSASVASLNGDITHGGTELVGCKSSWFSATNNAPAYGPLAGGASATGSVDVTMPNNTTDNQDKCQGAQPDINVSAG